MERFDPIVGRLLPALRALQSYLRSHWRIDRDDGVALLDVVDPAGGSRDQRELGKEHKKSSGVSRDQELEGQRQIEDRNAA